MSSGIVPNKLVRAGEVVFREGDAPTDGIFFICSGEVRVIRMEMGEERILAHLGEGDVFGEMGIVNGAPRNATVVATEDCGFFTMNQNNFQHRVNQLDPVMRGTFRVLVLTIRDFIAHRDVLLGQMQTLMQQMQQAMTMPGANPSQAAGTAEPPAGRLADGVERRLTY